MHWPRMKSSSHRPLILKRRKPPPSHGGDMSHPLAGEGSHGQGNGPLGHQQARTGEHSTNRKTPGTPKFPAGTQIISHPAMSDTQAVAIPAGRRVAAKEEWGHSKPYKSILVSSGSSSPTLEAREFNQLFKSEDKHSLSCNNLREEDSAGASSGAMKGTAAWASESQSMEGHEQEGNSSREAPSCELDNSLTNIQWLGKMSSDGLSPCSAKTGMQKENQTPTPEAPVKQTEKGAAPSSSAASWQASFTERPPYSYMAMIQFAINSTEKKHMTLKDIYTWIEDHFPYFRHVAKPGWKNSIRHNLSLHDMFVRETPANSKISFWTIHPEANRYLTLDQVFKIAETTRPFLLLICLLHFLEPENESESFPALESSYLPENKSANILGSGSAPSPVHLEPVQQKRHTPDLQKNPGGTGGNRTEPQPACRKMKPLLPRINSYLVPVQFPLSQSLLLQHSAKVPLLASQSMSEPAQTNKRVRIAPKVLPTSVKPNLPLPEISIKGEVYCGEESSPFAPHQSTKEDACEINRELFPAVLSIKQERDFPLSNEGAQAALPVEEPPLQGDEELRLLLPAPGGQKRQPAALKPPSQEMPETKRHALHEVGRSRRKQLLALPCPEEPVLLLPSSRGSESFTLEHSSPFEHPPGNVSQLNCSQGGCGRFKTPIKEVFCKLPASSTPCKMPTSSSLTLTDPWRLVPFLKETSTQDFSPRRSPPLPSLSLQENLDLSTSPRPSMFESPQPLLLNTEANDMVSGPLISSPASSNESPPQVQASVLPENCSLQDGLFLDTMNESLSKILLDISFPGFDEDNLGTDLSW